MSKHRSALLTRIENLPLRQAPEGGILCRQDTHGLAGRDLATEAYGEMIRADAERLRPKFQAIGNAISCAYTGQAFTLGDVKRIGRMMQKARERYNGDVSRVRDVSRGIIRFGNADQAIRLMDAFSRAGTYALGDRGLEFRLLEVENNISNPDPSKPGFRNLNLKIELWDAAGTHVAEIQARPGHPSVEAAYVLSHESYEAFRKALCLKQAWQEWIIRNPGPCVEKTVAKRIGKLESEAKAADRARQQANSQALESASYLIGLEGYEPNPERGVRVVDGKVDNSRHCPISSSVPACRVA